MTISTKPARAFRVRDPSSSIRPSPPAWIASQIGALRRRGVGPHLLQRPLPDRSRRDVDDPLEAHDVRVAAQDPQVRQGVLDLAALVEPGAADELVADAVAEERFLDRAALGVGAVHDGDVPRPEVAVLVVVGPAGQERALAADQRVDLARDPFGLFLLVVGLEALDRPAAGVLRPELLVLAAALFETTAWAASRMSCVLR